MASIDFSPDSARTIELNQKTETEVNQLFIDVSNKQNTLESGVNIKTINNESILGSGNLTITGGGGGGAVDSVNGQTGVVVLTKSDLSLGNVDNTSDVNKPISTATQTALDAKQNTITNSDSITQGSTNLFLTTSERTKLTNTSGTNSGDNAVNSLYSGLVSNATHTGDATGATVLTLATVNSNVGSFTNANITVNEKGLITAASSGSGGSGGGFTYPQLLSAISLRI